MGSILQLACLVLALICCAESKTIPDEALVIGSEDVQLNLELLHQTTSLVRFSLLLVILDATTGQSSATVQQPVTLAQTREVYNIAALDCKLIIIIELNVGIIIGVSKIRFWSSKWDG